MPARPPIIAVVGHIDHGKSTLQQAIRNANTELKEAGDITQHIGAYELHASYEGSERRATIIDTPGHEAFLHVREHGLEIADIALLVVSSEEGWKEQTQETYEVIQKLKTPFIIVFTKIDTEKANIETAKQSVLKQGILLEQLGGSIPWIGVSSTTGEGVSDLIDLIFLTTDVYEIVEDRTDGSVGTLVEADIDPKVGITGTVIVLQGSLTSDHYVRIGSSTAPLRIMTNDRGKKVTDVVPSTPVRIAGFDTVPAIGAPVFRYDSRKDATEAAKSAVSKKQQRTVDTGERGRTISLVIRSDTASGLTSIERAVAAVAEEGITFSIVKRAVGQVTEEDVRIAKSQDGGQVLGFHTTADQRAKRLAERTDTPIHLFPTIYEVTAWAKELSQEKRGTYELQNVTGEASIIRIFEEQPAQNTYIVGAQVTEGSFKKGQSIAIKRGESIAGQFVVESLEQRNKEQDSVSGEKQQFAMRIKGEGSVALQDTAVALPDLTDKSS
ncbi:MAG: GTP-binding protein [Candidatus Kaiserbacteria bacterium]|nr:GTP-binding protein [Candidatus Kaiserbacteria bacterium]